MIRTIADQRGAAASVDSEVTPLPDPTSSTSLLLELTAASGHHSPSITSSTDSVLSLLAQGEVTPGSVWPFLGIDAFTEFMNDANTIARPEDFNKLVSAIRAVQSWTLRVARSSPGDLTERLNAEGHRTL